MDAYIKEILNDFRICCISREISILGRKEVLTGKAKFGIVGDGKEVPQVAMARAFKNGDFRAGYYRDQTFMFAAGLASYEAFFAQLYADTQNDPFSGGRQMNAHFATPLIDADGNWLPLKDLKNVAADLAPTAGQMAKAVGLALASKLYRANENLQTSTPFSNNGNEVCFCTIGDASTSEGVFWEAINAAAVQQIPLAVSVWDDGYGISVPIKYQTTKQSISVALQGFQTDQPNEGIEIYTAKAWDYPALCKMYEEAIQKMRTNHMPALFHITEVTQPQGHSTSGDHRRYKSKERLQWEADRDCILVMADWMLENNIATPEQIKNIREEAVKIALEARNNAWSKYIQPILQDVETLKNIFHTDTELQNLIPTLDNVRNDSNPQQFELIKITRNALRNTNIQNNTRQQLNLWLHDTLQQNKQQYNTHLYSQSKNAATNIPPIPPIYSDTSEKKPGYELLRTCFKANFNKYPNLFAFGEDVGQIGDVNQGFTGLQQIFSENRIFDTGIREWTIMGQAIGMAMRGMRPIAEIQYLDYLIYALSPLSDDLACLRYRTNNIQHAPAIIRTRGHRLEGVWHTGSPMGMILHALRGICILTPRNMTQAAGFYNTLLRSDDPAIVIECLNGYRLHEIIPDNITDFCVPIGVPEILQQGTDLTLVTYGSCVRVAQDAITLLNDFNISVELIDVQSLVPFDIHHSIQQSLQKTNRLVILDEDVPGGASAFILQQILETQDGYHHLDSKPITITAQPHRTPYGSNGEYHSKPSADDVFQAIYQLIAEANPQALPSIYPLAHK